MLEHVVDLSQGVLPGHIPQGFDVAAPAHIQPQDVGHDRPGALSEGLYRRPGHRGQGSVPGQRLHAPPRYLLEHDGDDVAITA